MPIETVVSIPPIHEGPFRRMVHRFATIGGHHRVVPGSEQARAVIEAVLERFPLTNHELWVTAIGQTGELSSAQLDRLARILEGTQPTGRVTVAEITRTATALELTHPLLERACFNYPNPNVYQAIERDLYDLKNNNPEDNNPGLLLFPGYAGEDNEVTWKPGNLSPGFLALQQTYLDKVLPLLGPNQVIVAGRRSGTLLVSEPGVVTRYL